MKPDPLQFDWEKVQELVSQARQLRCSFPNGHYISDADRREIFEKLAKEIILLINPD